MSTRWDDKVLWERRARGTWRGRILVTTEFCIEITPKTRDKVNTKQFDAVEYSLLAAAKQVDGFTSELAADICRRLEKGGSNG